VLLFRSATTTTSAPDDVVAPVGTEGMSQSKSMLDPGLVRIVVTEASEERLEGGSGGGDGLLGEFQHLGPLPQELDRAYRASFAHEAQRREAMLQKLDVDSADAAALFREAELLAQAAQFRASEQALERGDYVVTGRDSAPPLSLPGAEVVQIPTAYGDKPVTLTIIMPLGAYPRLSDTLSYRQAVHDFRESERARKFNALPDVERVALARRIAAIQANPDASDEDRQFVYETIGWNRLAVGPALVVSR
jgi:hypothetical protein